MLQGSTPSERLATERLLRTTTESPWEKGLRLAKEVCKNVQVRSLLLTYYVTVDRVERTSCIPKLRTFRTLCR